MRDLSKRAATAVVSTITITRGAAITLELVPLEQRTDVRIQLNRLCSDGSLRPKPLRVTFNARHLNSVIAALEQVRRVLATAVPIAEQSTLEEE